MTIPPSGLAASLSDRYRLRDSAVAEARRIKPSLRGSAYQAEAYTLAGMHEDALLQLERIVATRPGERTQALLEVDPTWDPLRDYPRFKALLRKT